MGNAMMRPGIDPRVWVSQAIVLKVVIDTSSGVFADVKLLPGGQLETARVSSIYAGPGFGLYLPLDVDDEVTIFAPNGDPDSGLVVLPRLWGGGDPPPAEIGDRPNDLLLFTKESATLRLVVSGSGSIVLDPRGSGKVKLGGEDGLEPTTLGQTLQTFLHALTQFLINFLSIFNANVQAYAAHTHGGNVPAPSLANELMEPDPQFVPDLPDTRAQKVENK
jgi:hypothetical protein